MAIAQVRKDQDPIRAELYSIDQLTELAKKLAGFPVQEQRRSQREHLRREERNGQILQQLYLDFSERDTAAYRTPAQDWFLDNFHLIIEQVRGVIEDLSPKFYAELPVYAAGPAQDEPRVYELALQLVAHTDSQIDPSILKEFIRAFQTIAFLTTGELWALAIFIRIVLIENITRLMICADEDCRDTDSADRFIEQLSTETVPNEQFKIDEFKEAFLTRLLLRLREKDPKLFGQLRNQLEERGKNIEELIWWKTQELTNSRVSVSNAIVSLRVLASIDWPEFIDSVSEVDRILRSDPADVYAKCDFNTRDRYRHSVEQIARHSRASEIEVAQLAVTLAEQSNAADQSERIKHVGFYLVDEGRFVLEKATNFKAPARLRLKRVILKHPMLFYQSLFLLFTLLITGLIAYYMAAVSDGLSWVFLVFLIGLIPSSAIALTLTNWLITIFFRPEYTPRLEFKKGIPPDLKTIVALPTLLSSTEEIQELMSRLEIHYLANHEDQLEFALLTDFTDADTPTVPNDARLLQEAKDKIGSLNRKYPRSTGPRFHLFHRSRQWNPVEGKWMGWERKRGKLEEFNRLLLGKDRTSFEPAPVPHDIRFVITLDSDTILPRDTARKLVGIHAHPLVRPVFEPVSKKVIKGYGILQPRVSHTLSSANSSLFARAFSGPSGIDPYTRAVSDVYQDLFGEASFIGKGIYDLAAFHSTVG